MRKWSVANMWASSVPAAQHKEAAMQQKFEAQEESRAVAEEAVAGEPKPTPRAENILAKLSASKFRSKNAAREGFDMNSPFGALAPEPAQVCAHAGACSGRDVHLEHVSSRVLQMPCSLVPLPIRAMQTFARV